MPHTDITLKFFRKIAQACLILISFPALSHANNDADAIALCYKYFDQNLMQKARLWCKKASEQKDKRATLFLAISSLDDAAEFNWYLRELQTNPEASTNTDLMAAVAGSYADGVGTEKNYKKAVFWYTRADKYNSTSAALDLAQLLSTGGYGIDSNLEKAFYWYQKAANQNNTAAFEYLGHFYSMGLGIEKNIAQAKKWYQKAIDNYNPRSSVLLGLILQSEARYTQAITLWEKASNGHDAHAQFLLGFEYFKGKHIKKDYQRAIELFKISAQCSYTGEDEIPQLRLYYCQRESPYYLGLIYAQGYGVSKDSEQARIWYLQAANMGNKKADNALKELGDH
ncbi:hypothetical protein MNBD_GAMMA10-277 [hydrothermal vent metagenome]|uniref:TETRATRICOPEPTIDE REPEAT FAMILY PROTEIN n=1 Tax=hydrothermal vent metagenome TaxID=652676 RepID=A0A3B0Y7Q4_9ZZZZ